MSSDLFTFGEVLSVFITTDSESVMTAKSYQRVTAGAEANVAVVLARLGLKSTFYSRFGTDQLGSVMIQDIQNEGVDVSLVKRVSGFTAAMVRNPGMTQPVEISYLRKGSAASTIEPEDILDNYLTASRWLHTTGITCAISESGTRTVRTALAKARQLGVKASLDLNLRRKLWSESEAKVVLEPLASNLELLIGGEDEYQAVFGFSDAKQVLKDANKRGCRIAVMTKADQVLRYSIDSEYGEIMPPKVKSVDPVGSGDAFTGGTIAGLLSGLTAEQALKQGSICGASVASMFGDWTGIPTGKSGLINSDVLSKIGSPK